VPEIALKFLPCRKRKDLEAGHPRTQLVIVLR
jgi:hypothetical protein